MRYCAKCGTPNEEEFKFCQSCGAEMVEIPPVVPMEDFPEVAPAFEIITIEEAPVEAVPAEAAEAPAAEPESAETPAEAPTEGAAAEEAAPVAEDPTAAAVPEVPAEEPAEKKPASKKMPQAKAPKAKAPQAKAPQAKKPFPRKYIAPIVVAALVVVALAAFLIVFFLPVNQFGRALSDGAFTKAAQIWQTNLQGSGSADDAAEAVDELIAETVAAFEAEEMSYEDAWAVLEAVDVKKLPSDSLAEAQTWVSALHTSRESWKKAQSAYTAEDYETSVLSCEAVIPEDEDYEYARKLLEKVLPLWLEEILAQAEELQAAGDFTAAQALLDSHAARFAENETFAAAVEACGENMLDYEIGLEVENAKQNLYNGDYAAAFAKIDMLEQTYGKRQSVIDGRTQVEDLLCDIVLQTVSGYYALEEFERAMEVLEQGLAMLPENEVLTGWLAACRSRIPVLLAEMEFESFSGEDMEKIGRNLFLQDTAENIYTSCLTVPSGDIVIRLDGQYTRFSGMVACASGMTSDAEKASATLEIYAGETLLFTSEAVKSDSQPVPVDLDVTGMETITLRWTCQGTAEEKDWGHFAALFDGALYPVHVEP